MSAPEIVFAKHSRVAHVRLNRPQTLNALTISMLDRLTEILEEIEQDDTLCAVVLSGSSRAFSSGADLKELREDARGVFHSGEGSFPARLNEVLIKLERCPVPVIASVQGWALAGGLEILLCCDLIIAGRNARFGDAHAKYGLLPSGGASARLATRVGFTRAREMMFTGDWYTAEAMREAGLVSRAVEDHDVEPESKRIADCLADRSPSGLRKMKHLLLQAPHRSLAEALAAEQRAWAEHASSLDMREGLSAFREKRKPRFVGR